jgi:arylesterase/paraoxonase
MRILWIIVALIVALIAWRGYEFADKAGFFRSLTPVSPGNCKQVTGVIGPEDITIDQERGIAYISGYDRRATFLGYGQPETPDRQPSPGAIWAYDLNAADPAPVNLTPDADSGFQPHGISLHIDTDGTRRLFVVNHGNNQHSIELFELTEFGLVRVKTWSSSEGTSPKPEIRSPNDVLAVAPRKVYFTNDHLYPPGHFMRFAEDFLGVPLSDVYYLDGGSITRVVSGIAGANGINVSADRRTVYLAAARGGAIHVFDRDINTGQLTKRKSIAVPGLPDNIELEPDGKLLVALHAKAFAFLDHVKDAAKKAPSQIVRVDPETGTVETVYLNLGEELSAASTGARWKNRLLIGAIFDARFLDCTLGEQAAAGSTPG